MWYAPAPPPEEQKASAAQEPFDWEEEGTVPWMRTVESGDLAPPVPSTPVQPYEYDDTEYLAMLHPMPAPIEDLRTYEDLKDYKFHEIGLHGGYGPYVPAVRGEVHIHGANFIGPGTETLERIKHGVKPTTRIDAAAMMHDLDYIRIGALLDQGEITNNEARRMVRMSDKSLMDIVNKRFPNESLQEQYQRKVINFFMFGKDVMERISIWDRLKFLGRGESGFQAWKRNKDEYHSALRKIWKGPAPSGSGGAGVPPRGTRGGPGKHHGPWWFPGMPQRGHPPMRNVYSRHWDRYVRRRVNRKRKRYGFKRYACETC